MRNITITFFVLLFFWACNETSITTISVANKFKAAGEGKMVSEVENEGAELNLKGTLELDKGKFNIYLADPTGDTIYSESYADSGSYKIDEKFDRKIGAWVFSYTITNDGDIVPVGNFNFDITYND